MLDRILLLIPIFATSTFGAMTIIMGYRTLQKLSTGRLKDYGMTVWYALVLFSVGGALHTYQELFGVKSLMSISLVYFEYFFYSAYYIVLLFAVFSLYRMSKFIGFNRKSKEMVEAMKKIKGVGEGDGR